MLACSRPKPSLFLSDCLRYIGFRRPVAQPLEEVGHGIGRQLVNGKRQAIRASFLDELMRSMDIEIFEERLASLPAGEEQPVEPAPPAMP